CRAIGSVETDQSGVSCRDSLRSRIVCAKIDRADGRTEAGADYEGRHRHYSRAEIDVEELAFLAKRYADSARPCYTHRRINSLERRSQEFATRAKYPLAG